VKQEPSPITAEEILNELLASNRHYIHQPLSFAFVDCVYVLLTHCFQHFDYCPIILITSPLEGCGKTRKLDWFERYVNKPEATGNATQSSLFRIADARKPTFLIDEFDSQHPESRAAIANILNNGFQRGKKVSRTDQGGNGGFETKSFDVFGPKIVACISADKFSAATTSRAINHRMQRNPSELKMAKLGKLDGTELQNKCQQWVSENQERIEQHVEAGVYIPQNLSDRQGDAWEALIILSTFASKVWEERICNAALELHDSCKADTISSHEQILIHCRELFLDKELERISSEDLADYLNNQNDWQESHYHSLNTHKLANLLRDFGICPEVIHFREKGGKKLRGYYAHSFEKAFKAYLPPLPSD